MLIFYFYLLVFNSVFNYTLYNTTFNYLYHYFNIYQKSGFISLHLPTPSFSVDSNLEVDTKILDSERKVNTKDGDLNKDNVGVVVKIDSNDVDKVKLNGNTLNPNDSNIQKDDVGVVVKIDSNDVDKIKLNGNTSNTKEANVVTKENRLTPPPLILDDQNLLKDKTKQDNVGVVVNINDKTAVDKVKLNGNTSNTKEVKILNQEKRLTPPPLILNDQNLLQNKTSNIEQGEKTMSNRSLNNTKQHSLKTVNSLNILQQPKPNTNDIKLIPDNKSIKVRFENLRKIDQYESLREFEFKTMLEDSSDMIHLEDFEHGIELTDQEYITKFINQIQIISNINLDQYYKVKLFENNYHQYFEPRRQYNKILP